jgi:hypothetical protein
MLHAIENRRTNKRLHALAGQASRTRIGPMMAL